MAAHTATEKPARALSTRLAGLVIVLTSVALSTISFRYLQDTVRVRWTIGTYQHYGPEYASTSSVLVAFPVLAAVLFVGARWLEAYLERRGELDDLDDFRAIYDGCVLLVLGTVVAGQLLIVVLNL